MGTIIKRLLVFFIGVPVVVFIILFLPHFHHLTLNIIVIVFSALGAVEFAAILGKKQMRISITEAVIFGSFAPLACTLITCFNFPLWIIPVFFMSAVCWVMLTLAFTRHANMLNAINRLAGCSSVIIYPGLFMSWLVKMSEWEISSAILFFVIIIFCNDSASWLAGSLFGANNKGIFPASPNKSIAGYIGGIIGVIIISVSAALVIPYVSSLTPYFFPGSNYFVRIIILGVITAIFGNFGDLAESAIKRSVNIKDSGNLMLGRGGILDSIDSFALSAPVYFLLFNIFFIYSR